jgi:hypothetical protein
MNTGWLIFFMLMGGVIALAAIQGWFNLLEHLPRRKRPLKCLTPYVPVAKRSATDDSQSTHR